MDTKYPFHYEVRFRLSAYDNENNVRHESFFKTFSDKNPLVAREQAFSYLEDYIELLKETGKISTDSLGNFNIIQPDFIKNTLDESSRIGYDEEWLKTFEFFKEEISIYLIVTDDAIAKEVLTEINCGDDEIQTEFEIHKVASYTFDKQDIIDHLQLEELRLYNYFKIEADHLKRTVLHFGLDYAEEGEDIEAAKRVILKTPLKWNTIEYYKEHYNSVTPAEEDEKTHNIINYKEIIARGENNQIEFKSTFSYNSTRKSWQGKYDVNYKIAKTICGFLNSNGGTLFVGVDNNGGIIGLDADYSIIDGENKNDKLLLSLDKLIVDFFGRSIKPLINGFMECIEKKKILIIEVQESPKPILLTNTASENPSKEMFIRMTASTHQLKTIEETIEYIFNKKWEGHNY